MTAVYDPGASPSELVEELTRRGDVRSFSWPASTTTVRLAAGSWYLHGWGVLETTGTASATVEIWDGTDTTGQLVVPIALSSGQSARDWIGLDGIAMYAGMLINVVSGSVRGTLWARKKQRPGPPQPLGG